MTPCTSTKRLDVYVVAMTAGKCLSRIFIAKERVTPQSDAVDRLLTIGVIGCAQVVLNPPEGFRRVGRYPILQEIFLCDDMRGCGLGLEFLEAIVTNTGPLDAAWVSRSGIALAKAYERRHGTQPWHIAQVAAEDMSNEEAAAVRSRIALATGGVA